MPELVVTDLVLDGAREDLPALADVLGRLGREARKKGVHAVRFRLAFDGGLALEGEVVDRGATLVVPIAGARRRYALSEDGVHQALADVVRVVHGGAESALDAYERVLTGGRSRRR